MRIWSLHPRHLDRQGLVACWRETLLAQAVLAGRTAGYRHHPQLERFREVADPLEAIAAYLHAVAAEADRRGYRFDRARIDRPDARPPRIPVTDGQLAHERRHLLRKLEARSPDDWRRLSDAPAEAHPSFTVAPGPVASWERVEA